LPFNLFDTTGFPPRWECGPAWHNEPWLGWLHIGSDIATWGAYTAIPFVLLYLLGKRRGDMPFPRIVWLFGAFIFACGTVHLIEASLFWWPAYRFSGAIKLATAAVSWVTVLALFRVVPQALHLRSPRQLEEEVERRTRELAEMNLRIHTEIARREEVAMSLMRNEERLRVALHAGRMGTWDWNLETDRVLLDATERELTGIGGNEGVIPIDKFFDRVHDEDRQWLRERVDHCIATHEAYDAEFRFVTPQGQVRWLAGRGGLVTEPDGTRRMVGVNFDLTEHKQMEDALEEARREAESANQAKSEFLANMSHEIRTPLTAILGCADILVRDAREAENREMSEMIRNQGELLTGILNDVLDLSKIEAGKLEVRSESCSLAAIIADVRSLLEPTAREKGLELVVDFQTQLPRIIHTDPLRLRQILINLVGNAIKFTHAGNVTIVARYDASQKHPLSIAVTDTGIGIPPESLGQIFEAFSQAANTRRQRHTGSGLGLTICQRLSQMLGGEIEASSELHRGTTMTVRLPHTGDGEFAWLSIDEVPPSTAQAPAASELAAAPRCKVLAAEDSRGIQVLLKRLLQPLVGELTIVEDGEQAVAELQASIAAGEPYDLVLMDMQMPVLDGYAATQRLRESGVATPIIALTASAMAGDREKCLAAGCNTYLSKPLDRALLVSAIAQWARNGS
jgi:signal transduction histidine kinase